MYESGREKAEVRERKWLIGAKLRFSSSSSSSEMIFSLLSFNVVVISCGCYCVCVKFQVLWQTSL